MLPSGMRGFDRFPAGQGPSGSGVNVAGGAGGSQGLHFQQDVQGGSQPQAQQPTPFCHQDPVSQVSRLPNAIMNYTAEFEA